MTALIDLSNYCPFCSTPPIHLVVHQGVCPKVRAIEYFEDGSIKKIEFKEYINAGFREFDFISEVRSDNAIDFTASPPKS